MTGVDDFDEDAPIPYVLTALARRDLARWRAEAAMPPCPHEWDWSGGNGVCMNCGVVTGRSRQPAIPSYLGPKSEWKRR